jgi:hypothetical protein
MVLWMQTYRVPAGTRSRRSGSLGREQSQFSHHETSRYLVEKGNDGGPEFRNRGS